MPSLVRRRVLHKGPDHPLGGQKPTVTHSVDLAADAEDAKRQVYAVPLPESWALNGLVALTYMSRMDF